MAEKATGKPQELNPSRPAEIDDQKAAMVAAYRALEETLAELTHSRSRYEQATAVAHSSREALLEAAERYYCGVEFFTVSGPVSFVGEDNVIKYIEVDSLPVRINDVDYRRFIERVVGAQELLESEPVLGALGADGQRYTVVDSGEVVLVESNESEFMQVKNQLEAVARKEERAAEVDKLVNSLIALELDPAQELYLSASWRNDPQQRQMARLPQGTEIWLEVVAAKEVEGRLLLQGLIHEGEHAYAMRSDSDTVYFDLDQPAVKGYRYLEQLHHGMRPEEIAAIRADHSAARE